MKLKTHEEADFFFLQFLVFLRRRFLNLHFWSKKSREKKTTAHIANPFAAISHKHHKKKHPESSVYFSSLCRNSSWASQVRQNQRDLSESFQDKHFGRFQIEFFSPFSLPTSSPPSQHSNPLTPLGEFFFLIFHRNLSHVWCVIYLDLRNEPRGKKAFYYSWREKRKKN